MAERGGSGIKKLLPNEEGTPTNQATTEGLTAMADSHTAMTEGRIQKLKPPQTPQAETPQLSDEYTKELERDASGQDPIKALQLRTEARRAALSAEQQAQVDQGVKDLKDVKLPSETPPDVPYGGNLKKDMTNTRG